MKKAKRGNYKQTMAQNLKRARAGLLGLNLSWTDTQPLVKSEHGETISDFKVWHKNPTNRLICQDMWRQSQKWIVENEFTWLVIIKIFYESNRVSMDKVDIGEFKCTCAIRYEGDQRMDDKIEKFIIECRLANYLVAEEKGIDHKSYGVFQRAEFSATIVGI